MASEWETSRLGDCVTHQKGFAFKSADYRPGGHPIVRVSNFTDRSIDMAECSYLDHDAVQQYEAYKLRHRDAVIATVGSWPTNPASVVGKTICVPEKAEAALLNQNAVRLRTKADLDQRFLFYLLKQPVFQTYIVGTAQGSASQASITLNDIFGFEFQRPPLAEQKAIAAALGALDDKIELNRRMNATLEAMARALFQSWFVDFDPVRAKLDAPPAAALDPATAALFPEHLEDSPVGHIPKGWKATTLGACIGFRSGFSFKSQDWQESGVPVVKIGSVKPGIIDLTQVSYVSEEIAQQASRYRLSTGDMLIGMTGYVGEVGLVPPSDNPPLLNQRVGKFVMAKPGTESLAFWYCTTRQPEFKAFVEARSHGTAQANVSGESIMEFPLVVPPDEILDSFNRDCQPLLDRILSNHGESRTLATLRDTLLPKLLTGELSVAETP
jgi:type I restriction enzyme S subunit